MHKESSRTQKNTLQLIRSVLISPPFIVFIICSVLISYNLVKTYYLRPFTSDDVFWQTILLTWEPFKDGTVTLGNSSIYVDKIPFFSFFNGVFDPSRKILFLQSAIACLTGFAAFYVSSMYFLKKLGAKLSYLNLSPFIWFASFGYSIAVLYLNPNWRGFQIGISFATFALVAAVYYDDLKIKSIISKALVLLFILFAGLQLYSDPYFLYFTLGPITLLSIVLFLKKKATLHKSIIVFGSSVLAVLFAKLFAAVSSQAGIRTSVGYPMQFVPFDKLWSNIDGSLQSLLVIFSADFFGLKVTTFDAVIALLNFSLVGVAFYMSYRYISRRRVAANSSWDFMRIWETFFAAVGILIIGTYTFSTLAEGSFTYRYLLMLVLVLVLLLAIVVGTTKNTQLRNLLACLLLLSSLGNLVITQSGQQDARRSEVVGNRANALNYTIIDVVKSEGYSKGYTNYWLADISTYLSGGKISFLPSLCASDTKKFHWLINDEAFEKTANRTFYLIDPDIPAPATCPVESVIGQLGEPVKTVYIGNKTLLLYDYDISSKIDDFRFPES